MPIVPYGRLEVVEPTAGDGGATLTSNFKTIADFMSGGGASGFSGMSGISGISGFSGVSGISGTSGISGISGFSGVSGWSGTSGMSGFSGALGVSGISGVSGLSGTPGQWVNTTGGISYTTTDTQSTGTPATIAILPTYQQTSSAAATDLRINRVETSVGSGAQLFLDCQVSGVSKASIDHTGSLTAFDMNLTDELHLPLVNNKQLGQVGARSILPLVTQTWSDRLQFAVPTALEYWDFVGSAWTDWSSNIPAFSAVFSGHPSNSITVVPTNRKWRATFSGTFASYAGMLAIYQEFTSANPLGYLVGLEESTDGVSWTTRLATQTIPNITYYSTLFTGASTVSFLRLTIESKDSTGGGLETTQNAKWVTIRYISDRMNGQGGQQLGIPFSWDANKSLTFPSSLSAASGTQKSHTISPTLTQSGTAGATDLLINRVETSIGNGNQYFIDMQVAGATKAHIDHNGALTCFNVVMTGALILQQAASIAPVSGATLTTNSTGVVRCNPASAITGVILQAPTSGGQQVCVLNEAVAGNTITFDVAGTSHVADGAASPIAGLTCRKYTWDSGTSLWYRVA